MYVFILFILYKKKSPLFLAHLNSFYPFDFSFCWTVWLKKVAFFCILLFKAFNTCLFIKWPWKSFNRFEKGKVKGYMESAKKIGRSQSN